MVMFYSIINPAKKEISKVSYLIRKGMAAKERIDKILGADNPIHDPERPVPLPAGIEKSRRWRSATSRSPTTGKRDVLRDINLTVRPRRDGGDCRAVGKRKVDSGRPHPAFLGCGEGSITVDGIDVK